MRGRKKDTLCWDCTKAAAKSCAWAGRFEPVKGWKAERVQRLDLKGGETFHVISCPEFEPDRRPEQPKRKDAYTEHDLCVIRNSLEDGESVSMIAWRLGRSLSAVTYKIRKMRRAGEL